MADDTRISDIVAQAEEAQKNGHAPDLVALCDGDSALVAEVRQRLRILGEADRMFAPRPTAPLPPQPRLPAGYELVGELGEGGMGVVYLARDEKGQTVAVKTLTRLDPARLDYLKREGQALAGVRHENLVAIYKLMWDGANWFCVMEYVEGAHLLEYVRAAAPEPDGSTTPLGTPDCSRLRSAFAQLAAGVHYLHAAKLLHRDIKSVNVKVTREGHVKLLDFGLVAEIDPTQERPSGPVGTVDHMSPEQFGKQPLTPATDWYSFGVMLYAALCGQLPFTGNMLEIMRQKETAPRRPSELVPAVPPDLESLCLELLYPKPTSRPNGEDVLRRLGAAPPLVRRAPVVQHLLLGREPHLAALREAAVAVRRTRRPIIVEVHGPSGGGKTALVERFLQEIRGTGDPVILTGRCYEQSSVPYKALDSLIDALCRYLRRLSRDQVAAVLPVHLSDLARLFPVLGRLEAVAEAPPANLDDPHDARRRAFQALRELLSRIGLKKPLFLFADDLQWGDRESAALFAELVRPPDAPPLLFLASYRRRDADTSPFVTALRAMPAERREIAVDPLTEAEARDLAAVLLGPTTPQAERFAEVIGRESAGNPFLIHELVEFQSGTPDSTDPPTFETVIQTRLARLAEEPRRLLEVVALSAGPLEVDCAFRAAEIAPARQAAALDVLLTGRSVRTSGGDGTRTVEPYHDRVRETIACHLPVDVRVHHHRRLAVVLTAAGDTVPESLAYHFAQAGEAGRAAEFYTRAGEQSAKVLAFDRAAEQYRLALDLYPPADARRKDVLLARAAALANGARAEEAAAAFALAAELCTGTEALFCRQRAAEQLIRGGRIDEGVGVLRVVLAGVGVEVPATERALRRSLLWLRLRLWFRGLRFLARPANEIPTEERLRTEICRWAAGVIRLSDLLLGSWFHSLGLLLSLRAGDTYGVAFALGREAIIPSLVTPLSSDRFERIMRRARDTSAGIANPDDRAYTEAVLQLYRVVGYYLLGDHRRALAEVPATDEGLRTCTGPGVAFQRTTARIFEASTLLMTGNVTRFRTVFEESYRALTERGNLHGAVTLPLLCRAHQLDLAADRPTEARQRLQSATGLLSRTGVHMQHMYAWWCEIDVLLYEGRGTEAWDHCCQWWDRINRPALLAHYTHTFVLWTRARAAVAFAAETVGESPKRHELLRTASACARKLERLRAPMFALAFGWSIRAAVAHLRDDRASALRYLERAESEFTRFGMMLHVAAVTYRRGQLLGDDAGATLVAQAETEFRTREVRNPTRFVEVYAPGFRLRASGSPGAS